MVHLAPRTMGYANAIKREFAETKARMNSSTIIYLHALCLYSEIVIWDEVEVEVVQMELHFTLDIPSRTKFNC